MINKKLFKIAIKYVEKDYSADNLRYGDDLYNSTIEEVDLCLEYYFEIKDNGLKWAYEQLKKH